MRPMLRAMMDGLREEVAFGVPDPGGRRAPPFPAVGRVVIRWDRGTERVLAAQQSRSSPAGGGRLARGSDINPSPRPEL